MNPIILQKRGIDVVVPEEPRTYNHLRPGDLLYVTYQPQYYLIFVAHHLDNLEFIRVHRFGTSLKHRIPRESVSEGDQTLEDSGWEIYRP